MKKLIRPLIFLSFVAVLASARSLGTPLDDFTIVTTRADGSTNTWTMADAADSLGLVNRKYWREMRSEPGRISWHGAITNRVPIVSELIILDYHEDGGFVWTNHYTKAQYDHAMNEPSGRVKWHGARTLYEVNTNDLTITETYADGYVWTQPWLIVTPEDSVEVANLKRLKAATLVGGQPAALRAARARRLQEASTSSNVVYKIEVNGGVK